MSPAQPDAAAAPASRTSESDRRAWGSRIALALAVLGTLGLAASAWLLVPRASMMTTPSKPPLRTLLVDVSLSMQATGTEAYSWLAATIHKEAVDAQRAGEELSIIGFGSEVVVAYGPGSARGWLDRPGRVGNWHGLGAVIDLNLGANASRLASALEVARDLSRREKRASSKLVLLGDGTYTGADPRPLLEELRSTGIAVEWLEPPPPSEAWCGIGAIDVPAEIEEGAPLVASCEVFYRPAADATRPPAFHLKFQLGGEGKTDWRDVEVSVPEGLVPDDQGQIRWRVRHDFGPVPPGLSWVGVDSVDWLPVRCGGRSVVGVVSRSELDNAIQGLPGLQVVPVGPHGLGGVLGRLDAFVTIDEPTDLLPRPVRSSFLTRGGGWLALPGDEHLADFLGRDRDDPLPLRPPDPGAPRDVVLVVDRSGSMSGKAFETVQAAVVSLVGLALPRDAVELRLFADRLDDPIALKAPDDPRDRDRIAREAAERFSAGPGAGGPTALARSLEALATARERADRESLVLLLTDGRDTVDADARARCAKLEPRFKAARARLVVLAAGDLPDRETLTALAGSVEEVHEVGALSDSGTWRNLESVFRRELDRDRVREGTSLHVLPAPALLDPAAANTVGAEILRAMKPESASSWPPIQRYVRAKAAPGAEVLLVSETGDPLLAVQRVGLGLTAACAFAPTSSWGEGWAKRTDLLAPLLRALARNHREHEPRVRFEGDRMIVEGLQSGAPALLEARVFASDARAEDRPVATILLTPPVAGADPLHTREGGLPSVLDGVSDETMRSAWIGPGRHEPGEPTQFGGSGRCARLEIRSASATGDAPKFDPIELPFRFTRPSESLLPRKRLPRSAFGPPTGDAEAAARAERRPLPAGPVFLGASLLLLALGGFLGAFSRR